MISFLGFAIYIIFFLFYTRLSFFFISLCSQLLRFSFKNLWKLFHIWHSYNWILLLFHKYCNLIVIIFLLLHFYRLSLLIINKFYNFMHRRRGIFSLFLSTFTLLLQIPFIFYLLTFWIRLSKFVWQSHYKGVKYNSDGVLKIAIHQWHKQNR